MHAACADRPGNAGQRTMVRSGGRHQSITDCSHDHRHHHSHNHSHIITERDDMLKLCGFSASNYYNKVKLALLEKNLPFEEVLA
ncbi:glutathione S-transferase N-terminal domain-containing protein, partial [Mycobacterium tuberculosis]|nr:glutathione S-transferase N-terminal domain-containing protein [Mycobacterium tuberculosis]